MSSTEIKWAGPGYIVLNILRVANIISLFMDMFAALIVVTFKVMTKHTFYFDEISHIIMFIISFFFLFSEVSWKLEPYFAKYWPLLGRKSGLVFLGLAMMTLGCRILGDLNKDTTTVEVLGLPAMRILISAGSLSLVFGFLNIIATYAFCHRKLGITARQIRSYGAAVKPNMDSFEDNSFSPDSAYYATSLNHAGYYQASRKPSSSCLPLPIAVRYGSRSSPPKKSDISPPTLQDLEKAENIAKHCSPVVPGLERPPTAMHPAYQHNYPNTSRFSEVSAISSRI